MARSRPGAGQPAAEPSATTPTPSELPAPERPGYRAPAWLALPGIATTREKVALATSLGPVEVEVCSPAAASAQAQLPLLLCHDGPDADRLGLLTRYVAALVRAGQLPAMRVALLGATERSHRYAADPEYTSALVHEIVPSLLGSHPSRHRPVLAGQSLGALAALHAGWRHPEVFAGLLLQSGSFFTPELDAQESQFARFAEVTASVAVVHHAAAAPSALPRIAMTCGTEEENLANNLALHARLNRLGVPVSWAAVRDGHTWTCWRDTFHPALTSLLQHCFT